MKQKFICLHLIISFPALRYNKSFQVCFIIVIFQAIVPFFYSIKQQKSIQFASESWLKKIHLTFSFHFSHVHAHQSHKKKSFLYLLHVTTTDIALIKENARVAAQIALELEKLQENGQQGMKVASVNTAKVTRARPLVVGGSILDIHYHVNEDSLKVSETIVIHIKVMGLWKRRWIPWQWQRR